MTFHPVKLTSLGKSRVYGERSGLLRGSSKDLEETENNSGAKFGAKNE